MKETYDIVLSSPFSNYDFFAHKLRELCGQMGLSFFLVDDVWVKEFFHKVQTKEVSVRVLLDLTANQTMVNDPYTALAKEIKRQGGCVIDDPDTTAAVAHKAKFHNMLLQHHIPVPETIVVGRSELETFKLTNEIKTLALG
jgi:glutathione synthase/RimK-type ligase-like ATP-grasp enzyme